MSKEKLILTPGEMLTPRSDKNKLDLLGATMAAMTKRIDAIENRILEIASHLQEHGDVMDNEIRRRSDSTVIFAKQHEEHDQAILELKNKNLIDVRNVMKNVSTEVDRINSRLDALELL